VNRGMASNWEGFEVRGAVLNDINQLRNLECEAAKLFAQVPELAHFANGDPSMTVERQIELVKKKTIWVVGNKSSPQPHGVSEPCAFLAADRVDKSLHIFELSVAPKYQRRGLAGLLIEAAVKQAEEMELESVSLTTDRHVPWNGPMYAQRGFEEIDPSKLGPGHVKIVAREKQEGLDIHRRCTMVRMIG
jgi:N-acetylglutamate synthase-like GNAT family acetyltransferase